MFIKAAVEKKSQRRKISVSYILSKNSKTILHFLLVNVPKSHFFFIVTHLRFKSFSEYFRILQLFYLGMLI